jgi:hypothetical protein
MKLTQQLPIIWVWAQIPGRGGNMKSAAGKILILVSSLLLSILVVSAKDNGKEKHHGKESKSANAHVDIDVFIGEHREMIRNHYICYADRGSLPPGLAKRGGNLPPGLEKQLRRNGHLPPGLEKKIYPFPVEVERRLPPLRPGLSRGIIGGSAVIVDKKTSVILDIFAVL